MATKLVKFPPLIKCFIVRTRVGCLRGDLNWNRLRLSLPQTCRIRVVDLLHRRRRQCWPQLSMATIEVVLPSPCCRLLGRIFLRKTLPVRVAKAQGTLSKRSVNCVIEAVDALKRVRKRATFRLRVRAVSKTVRRRLRILLFRVTLSPG